MTSKLERTWWFMALTGALAAFSTGYLLYSAGLPLPATGLAQWVVYCLCFAAFQRGFSFALWLLALGLAPSSPTLDRVK